ncbi:unnamed protein product [Didymodactylos carnosus]|uniref:Uncharacterized protein n=1 Tax=Didymodactylos carnosus TaxID=1234261 RepID=A0A815V3S6_9BILA|nr:unnamed protein product [Didymodactylos carnosus]CAF4381881.1 unnamed protein product [Didymodactylos carnosus]
MHSTFNFLVFFISAYLLATVHLEKIFDKSKLVQVKIFSNVAEVQRSLKSTELPLSFSEDEWNDIRSSTITLLNNNINIKSQTTVKSKQSINNQLVYVRKPTSVGGAYEMVTCRMVDETKNLVQQLNTGRYYIVSNEQIEYVDIPLIKNQYLLDFTFDKELPLDELVHISYLRSNLSWRSRYNLQLNGSQSVLTSYGDIHNNASYNIEINKLTLLTGSISMYTECLDRYKLYDDFNRHSLATYADVKPLVCLPNTKPFVFTINEPFIIESKAHFLVPISHTYVDVQCYNSLKKDRFSFVTNRGNMERSCKLLSKFNYLPKGNLVIRENEKILGELMFSGDIHPNDSYNFVLGMDPDVTYEEEIIPIGVATVNKSNTDSYMSYKNRKTIYQVNGKIRNFKNFEINVEYIINGDMFSGYSGMKILKTDTGHIDLSGISMKFVIPAEQEKEFSYTIQNDYGYGY